MLCVCRAAIPLAQIRSINALFGSLSKAAHHVLYMYARCMKRRAQFRAHGIGCCGSAVFRTTSKFENIETILEAYVPLEKKKSRRTRQAGKHPCPQQSFTGAPTVQLFFLILMSIYATVNFLCNRIRPHPLVASFPVRNAPCVYMYVPCKQAGGAVGDEHACPQHGSAGFSQGLQVR